MTDREKIAARIRALLQKTVENGCTEDEAIAAAAKAAEMLERYNLSVDEVEMRASPFTTHTEAHDDLAAERFWKVAAAISELTHTHYWTSRAGVRPIEISFFGFEHEVLCAQYLQAICNRSMWQESDKLQRQIALLAPHVRRRRTAAFLDGMSDRLARRIRNLITPRPAGTGLVVLHDQLVAAAMAEHGHKVESSRARGSRTHEAEYLDDVAAANAVSLNSALSGATATRGMLR